MGEFIIPFAVVVVIFWIAAYIKGIATIPLEKLKSFQFKVDFFDKHKSNNQKE